jgi:hypothetical protein
LLDAVVEIAEEIPEPRTLCDGIGDPSIFRLRTGTRYGVLPFGRPGYECVAKVDAQP